MVQVNAAVGRVRAEAEAKELSATLTPCFYIEVVDEQDKPLSGERYTIHQGDRKDQGTLNRQGQAFFFDVDETKPFRFEIPGRVCAIVQGAVLLKEQLDKSVNEGGIEYGGTLFDWAWAEDKTKIQGMPKETLFWQEYSALRKKADFLRFELNWNLDELSHRGQKERVKLLKLGRITKRREEELERAQQKADAAQHEYNEWLLRLKRAQRRAEQAKDVQQRNPEAFRTAQEELRTTQSEYDRAKATHDAAQAKLDRAQKDYDAASATEQKELERGVSEARKRLETTNQLVDEYKKTAFLDGPSTFWQHDHITRRDIRIRELFLQEFNERIAVIKAVPMQIRVGPLVRFTSHKMAVIWVELESPGLVRVRFRKNDNQISAPTAPTQSEKLGEEAFELAHSPTVRVGGRHFAAVVIKDLEAETLYDYTLELTPLPAVGSIPVSKEEFKPGVFPKLGSRVLANVKEQMGRCSFRSDSRFLSFRTLRESYDDKLRFAYGSCRKWTYDTGGKKDPEANNKNGEEKDSGADMLEQFGRIYLTNKQEAGGVMHWPAFLLLVGDQIYADDIGARTGETIMGQRFGARLPGPLDGANVRDGAWAGRYGHRYLSIVPDKTKEWIDQTIASLKSDLADLKDKEANAGFTNDDLASRMLLWDLMERMKNQLQAFQKLAGLSKHIHEEDAHYYSRFSRLVRNHLLWEVPVYAKDLPEVKFLTLRSPRDQPDNQRRFHPSAGVNGGVHAADFAEYAFLYERAWGWRDSYARKVLAHLPTFMTFDDHEVTDDWNFNKAWVELLKNPGDSYAHWPATITDALIAYWMYQGWGNTSPDDWQKDPRNSVLLDSMKTGSDALPELRHRIRPLALERSKEQREDFPWHFQLPVRPLFLFLDTRTRRRIDGNRTIDVKQRDWIKSKLLECQHPVAFLACQTPLLLPRFASFGMKHPGLGILKGKSAEEFARAQDFEHMVIDESWKDFREMLRELNDTVNRVRAITFLSGDVHFSYNMIGRLPGAGHDCEILQLVCSGMKLDLGDNKGLLRKFLNIFSRHHKVDGLELTMGGFDKPGESQNGLLLNNSIAFVEVQFKSANEFNLRQLYFSQDFDTGEIRKPVVWYTRNPKDGGRLNPTVWPV